MIPIKLWAKDSPVPIAVGEAIVYTYDFADVGTPSAVLSEIIYDENGEDAGMLSGSPSIAGTVVTASKFIPTAAGRYRYRVSITISGNTVFGLCDFYCFDPSIDI